MLALENTVRGPYVKGTVNAAFLKETARLSYFDHGPLLAKEYLEKNGIHLIVLPHLPKTYLDGAAMLLCDGTPVVGMTLRYDRLDNFWFCLLHELAHVSKHLTLSDPIIIDDLDPRNRKIEEDAEIEKEADEMAMRASIREKKWKNWKDRRRGTVNEVCELAEELKIHPAIIAGRIRSEQKNYRILSGLIGHGEVRKFFPEECST
jgi:HTH-type transcriptional regulator/antitoxin HigA